MSLFFNTLNTVQFDFEIKIYSNTQIAHYILQSAEPMLSTYVTESSNAHILQSDKTWIAGMYCLHLNTHRDQYLGNICICTNFERILEINVIFIYVTSIQNVNHFYETI